MPNVSTNMDAFLTESMNNANTVPFTNLSVSNQITFTTSSANNTKTQLNLSNVATTGAYSDLSGLPTLVVNFSDLGDSSTVNLPTVNNPLSAALGLKADTSSLSTVATTGSYSDLSGLPTLVVNFSDLGDSATADLPTLNTPLGDALDLKVDTSSLSTVATTGDYNDLLNTPVSGAGSTQDADEVNLATSFGGFTTSDSVEDVLKSIIDPKSISTLRSNTIANTVLVGTNMANPVFTWNESGGVTGLTLSDNAGELSNQSVSGGSYTATGVTYTRNTPGTIVWTLNGSGVSSTSLSKRWVYPSYSGKKSSATPPLEAEITSGTQHVVYVTGSFSATVNTSDTEYGWFAVPDVTDFTTWFITSLNQGSIGDGEFIYKAGVVSIGGINYDLYMFSFASETNTSITLS